MAMEIYSSVLMLMFLAVISAQELVLVCNGAHSIFWTVLDESSDQAGPLAFFVEIAITRELKDSSFSFNFTFGIDIHFGIVSLNRLCHWCLRYHSARS